MWKWFYRISIIAMLFPIIGCGPRYYFNGESFSSSTDALQKQSEILSKALDSVKPTDNPVKGNALILIPSDMEIQKNFIIFGNNAGKWDREFVNYLIASTSAEYQFIAEAIQKRAIFSSVSVDCHNGNPATLSPESYDFLVFADVDGWFIKGESRPKALPIQLDKTISDINTRTVTFLDSINQKACDISKKIKTRNDSKGI